MMPRLRLFAVLPLAVAPLAAGLVPGVAHAQRPRQVTGAVGVSMEGYTANGIAGRRAPLAAEGYARASFNLMGLRSGLTLRYSTDDSRFRQDLNRIGFQSTYRTVTVGLGDVSPAYSRYSVAGTTMRGGAVEWRPGVFAVAVAAGQARRATPFGGFTPATFARNLYAGRVEAGRGAQRLGLIAVFGRDVAGSLAAPDTGTTPGMTFTLTPTARLSLGRWLQAQGELTGSAYTPDLRAPGRGPEAPFWGPLVPGGVRTGTAYGYAGEGEVRVLLPALNARLGYARVAPGFTSFGLDYLRPDEAAWRGQAQVRLFDGRLNVGASGLAATNGLDDALAAALRRRQFSATALVRPATPLALNFVYSTLTSETAPRDAALPVQRTHAQSVVATPLLVWQRGTSAHAATLALAHQWTTAAAPMPGLTNTTASAAYTRTPEHGVSLSLGANALWSDAGQGRTRVYGGNAGGGWRAGRLATSLTGTWARTVTEGIAAARADVLGLVADAQLRLSAHDQATLGVRAQHFTPESGTLPRFTEAQASLRYEHRF